MKRLDFPTLQRIARACNNCHVNPGTELCTPGYCSLWASLEDVGERVTAEDAKQCMKKLDDLMVTARENNRLWMERARVLSGEEAETQTPDEPDVYEDGGEE